MAFDLGAMLAEVSNSDTGRDQIEYISLDLLDKDPNNFYQLTGVEDLAANIATCGLQQPLRVREQEENPGRYRIVSGHRRRAALDLLRQESPDKWADAPCIVERDNASPALQQLRLIYANAHTRVLTAAEISEQAVQVEKLLYKLKEQGHEFPGRMRDHVAQAVGASKSKLARLSVIRNGLIEEWRELFSGDALPESVAYELARLKPEYQTLFFDAFKRRLKSLTVYHVTSRSSLLDRVQGITCSQSGGRCTHIPKMEKAIVREKYSYDCCDGCCCDCPRLQSCKINCPYSRGKQDKLLKTSAAATARSVAAEKKRQEEQASYVTQMYARVKQARIAAGVTLEQYLEKIGYRLWGSTVDEFRAHEDGLDIDQYTQYPFGYGSKAYMDRLIQAADVLNCSVDFLLGRETPVENPIKGPAALPQPGWLTSDPTELGNYVVLTQPFKGSKQFFADTREWDGSQWEQPEYDSDDVVFWMPLPEDP